jgi:hypothetical protein
MRQYPCHLIRNVVYLDDRATFHVSSMCGKHVRIRTERAHPHAFVNVNCLAAVVTLEDAKAFCLVGMTAMGHRFGAIGNPQAFGMQIALL